VTERENLPQNNNPCLALRGRVVRKTGGEGRMSTMRIKAS
jgi:hypothetical protein